MKKILLFLLAVATSQAIPLHLEKECKLTTRPDGSSISVVTYKSSDVLVLHIMTITPVLGTGCIQRIETYFFHGTRVYAISRLSPDSIDSTIQQPPKDAVDFQLQSEDLDHDGFPESVLITSLNLDSYGFKRDTKGEMIPVAPVIFENGKPTFYE